MSRPANGDSTQVSLALRRNVGPRETLLQSLEASLLVAILAAVYVIFRSGLGAPLQFDDVGNLAGLSEVVDFQSAVTFAFSGEAGPLGRPLSLLTFALQAPSWPDAIVDLQRVNVLIHLLNGALAACLALKLSRLFPAVVERPATIAIVTAGLWVLQPLLASTSLMLIQRMTLLAATATLVGLILFVEGRSRLGNPKGAGFQFMTVGIVGGTVMAVLSKESGALLPLYAWVLEVTLLRAAGLHQSRTLRVWSAAFLAGPVILLVGYAAWSWGAILEGYGHRPFGMGERLATELVVLWDYVRLILLPKLSLLGPFHDDYEALGPANPAAMAATAAWATVAVGAFLARRRAPLLSFSIGWFVAGHLLESTVFPLELYFEHRNYLPSLGIVAVVAAGPFIAKGVSGRALMAGLLAYGMMSAWTLYQVTSLWGEPSLAAQFWAQAHPGSPRAAQMLARQLLLDGQSEAAAEEILAASSRMPQASDLALQSLQINCDRLSAEEFEIRIADLLERLPGMRHSYAAPKSLRSLVDMVVKGECRNLSENLMWQVGEALLANRFFRENGHSRTLLHRELARLARYRKDLSATMEQLELAFVAYPHPDTAVLMAETLLSAGVLDGAIEKLADACRVAERYPLTRSRWERRVQELRSAIAVARATRGV